MKDNLVCLYKKIGETPLDTITRYKQQHTREQDKLSFAGRLDPMAEGLLLVLVNEENKKRKTYESLAKTYECSFITGFATDTYDLLGKVTDQTNTTLDLIEIKKQIEEIVHRLPGEKNMPYPPYSSYHIQGKPLFYLARIGKLPPILPTKQVTIYQAQLLKYDLIRKEDLAQEIKSRIALVQGNFRQEEILELWEKTLEQSIQDELLLTHVIITCSSGTYIRQIVQTIGDMLTIPTVTFSIKRTAIGHYSLADIEE